MTQNQNIVKIEDKIGKINVLKEMPEHRFVPAEWQAMVNMSVEESVDYVITLWGKTHQKDLSTLLKVFKMYLVSVYLIEYERTSALLYIFKNPKGEYVNYIGYPPLASCQAQAGTILGKFIWPDKFLEFYTHVHNGWYEIESHAMGLMPVEEFFVLSEMEWGILDDITVDFSLDNILSVFSNSAGGYLCWNFTSSEPSGLIWWDDEEPDAVDFWDILDEWLAMGISDY